MIKWRDMPKHKNNLISTVGGWNAISFYSYCCWCIGHRWEENTVDFCFGNPNILPKIIYVTTHDFPFFYDNIYPNLNHRYYLLIVDHDYTVPNQIDTRFNYNPIKIEQWNNIVENKNIIHIFVSHLDIPATDKFSPFPVGFNPHEHPNKNPDYILNIQVDYNILYRPLIMKGCCRIRDDQTNQGTQWNDRIKVRDLCKNSWSNISEWSNIPKHQFYYEIQKYSFLLCPHGGGIEPNPKVFSAIYCGTIPIIKRFVNCEILYADLPIVIIEDWNEELITIDNLRDWREKYAHFFIDQDKRRKVLHKLTAKYWLDFIFSKS